MTGASKYKKRCKLAAKKLAGRLANNKDITALNTARATAIKSLGRFLKI